MRGIPMAVLLVALAGCSSSSPQRLSDAGLPDAGQPDAGLPDAGGPDGGLQCSDYGFVATGTSCGSGCASVTCSCPGAFPRSVSSCTTDGCIVAANCQSVCAAPSLSDALACTDTHTIAGPDGGGGGPDAGPGVACFSGPNPIDAAGNTVTVGDYDGDGKQDLIAVPWSYPSFRVSYGDGDGGFSAPVYVSTDFNVLWPHLADMNADGRLDVVYTDLSHVVVGLQQPDAGLVTVWAADAGTSVNELALGDLDQNGLTDVVAGDEANNVVELFYNLDGGAFSAPTLLPQSQKLTGVQVADLDNDGWPDLLVSQQTPSFNDYVRVLRNEHDGGFSDAGELSLAFPTQIACADLSGDGYLDVAVKAEVFLNDGGLGFARSGSYVGSGNAPAVGDLDGDHRIDLGVLSSSSLGWTIALSRNLPDGGFTDFNSSTQVPIPVPDTVDPESIAFGDFNGDGRIDLVELNSDHTGNVWLNTCGDAGVSTCAPVGFGCTANAQCCSHACAAGSCL